MKKRFVISFLAMFLVLAGLVVWNVFSGTVKAADGQMWRKVVMNIRLPRICAAILLGGALSVSGYLLQTFFGNPIAGPYVLGISSGAKLVVAVTMIFFMSRGVAINGACMVFAAFLGSMGALLFVLALSFKVRSMSVLVVCGIMTGYICSAVTDFLITFASDSNIVNLHNWSMGSFSGSDWNDVRIMAVLVAIGVGASFALSKPIGAYQLGESYARNMGVNVKVLRMLLILLSSLLSACVTAFAGPVSFVGIAVPHLVKSATGTARPLVSVPACFVGGAAITLLCDGIARRVLAPSEVAIGSVTAVLLVPVVIWMMLRRGKENA